MSPELKTIENPMEHSGFSMVAIKNHCTTQHFQYFGLPDLSPELEKPKKTLGILMVAIKKHCKTQCFCYFCSPRSLSRTSPKPLQNRDPKKLSLRIYIYIYMIWEQSARVLPDALATCISSPDLSSGTLR